MVYWDYWWYSWALILTWPMPKYDVNKTHVPFFRFIIQLITMAHMVSADPVIPGWSAKAALPPVSGLAQQLWKAPGWGWAQHAEKRAHHAEETVRKHSTLGSGQFVFLDVYRSLNFDWNMVTLWDCFAAPNHHFWWGCSEMFWGILVVVFCQLNSFPSIMTITSQSQGFFCCSESIIWFSISGTIPNNYPPTFRTGI